MYRAGRNGESIGNGDGDAVRSLTRIHKGDFVIVKSCPAAPENVGIYAQALEFLTAHDVKDPDGGLHCGSEAGWLLKSSGRRFYIPHAYDDEVSRSRYAVFPIAELERAQLQ